MNENVRFILNNKAHLIDELPSGAMNKLQSEMINVGETSDNLFICLIFEIKIQ